MPDTYTANLKITKLYDNQPSWGVIVNAFFDRLDGLSAIGGIAVSPAEIPSATLNVAVSPGTYRQASGVVVSYAGTATFAVTASTSTYLWLTDGGTLTSGTVWPGTPCVRLAVVTAGTSTISAIADARVTLATSGIPPVVPRTVTASATLLPTDVVVLANANSGAITLTLNAAAGPVVRVIKIDSSANAVSLAPASGTINGTSSTTTQYGSMAAVFDPASGNFFAF